MQCSDCPNQTDGTCCHQLIRPQGSKTMNLLDIQAWERELNHAAKMQEQREKITFSGGKTYEVQIKEPVNEKRA